MKQLITLIALVLLVTSFSNESFAAEKYLFYMNGCCVNKTGAWPYETIVKKLKADGFNVIFELRSDDSNTAIQAEIVRIATQVSNLLAKGTAPEDITVSGYSLGAKITLFASILIANPKVNYVLIAGCPKGDRFNIDYTLVQGRFLSIVDVKDDIFGSCKERLPDTVLQKEVELNSGYGHALFWYSDDKYVKLWKEPLEAWAMSQ